MKGRVKDGREGRMTGRGEVRMEGRGEGGVKGRSAALPREFWLVLAGTFVNRCGSFVLPMMVPFLVVGKGLPAGTAAVLVAVQGVGFMCSSPLGGVLTDRYGARRVIEAGLLCYAACALAVPVAGDVRLLAVVLLLLGLSLDVYRPAVQAFVAEHVRPERHVQAYGLLTAASNLGLPVAMLLAGLVAVRSFALLLVIEAATAVMFAGMFRLGTRRLRAGRTSLPRHGSGPTASPLRDTRLLVTLGCAVVVFTVYFLGMTVVPLAITDAGLRVSDYGLLMALNGAVVVVLSTLAGRLRLRSPLPVLVASYVLLGTGMALTGLATGLGEFAITVLIWSTAEIGLTAAGPAYVISLATEGTRGRYLGLFGSGFGIGMVLAPVAGIQAYEWNPAVLWACCLVLPVAAALAQLLYARRTSPLVRARW